MRICIVTCLYKRPELSKIVMDYYSKNIKAQFIAVQSYESTDIQPTKDGWHKGYAPNYPVAQKFNKAFEIAKNYNPDAVILIGSDDLLSPALIKYYQNFYSAKADYVLGLKDLYFYEIATRKAF